MPIHTDITIDAYHGSDALSKTKLADLDSCGPAYCHGRYITKTIPGSDTDALRFGRLFDDHIDDPVRASLKWAEPQPADLGNRPSDRERNAKNPSPETVARIARWDAYLTRNAGKVLVTPDERRMLDSMAAALAGNPHFARLWPMCARQVTIRRELPDLGVTLQARPDGLCLDHGFAVDVKTIDDIASIPRQTIAFSYAMQAAIAQWLLAQEGHTVEWYLAFVEKAECPRTRMFRIPELALNAEWARAKRLIREWSDRLASDNWAESYPEEIPVLTLEKWQERKLEALAEMS